MGSEPGSVNTAVGEVSGMVVQAGRITGDVTSRYGERPQVVWPHRVGVVPLRAACFQERAATTWAEDDGDLATLVTRNNLAHWRKLAAQ